MFFYHVIKDGRVLHRAYHPCSHFYLSRSHFYRVHRFFVLLCALFLLAVIGSLVTAVPCYG